VWDYEVSALLRDGVEQNERKWGGEITRDVFIVGRDEDD